MPSELLKYTLEELLNGRDGIIVQTQPDTEIMIRVERGKTLVLFPFGNVLETPEQNGHLSAGVVALDELTWKKDSDGHLAAASPPSPAQREKGDG